MHDTNRKKHVENEEQENSEDHQQKIGNSHHKKATTNFSELYVISNLKEKNVLQQINQRM